MLCDPDRTLGLAYQACSDASAKYPDRITYVIDEQGVIEKAYGKVNVQSHSDDILSDFGVKPPKRGFLQRWFGKK